MPKQNLQFNLALVTGASSGIGMALCRLLANKGVSLLISGRDILPLDTLAKQLRSHVPVSVVVADLIKPEGRNRLIEVIRAQTPDLIINSAGFGLYGPVLSHETSQFVDMVEVNAKTVVELTLEGARSLVNANKKGVILNVSSAAGDLVFPNFAVYSATKAFVTNFSQSVDYELISKNVRVLTSCPGMVKTAFRKRASEGADQKGSSGSMDPNYAAMQIWKQIVKRQRKKIFNWKTSLGIFVSHLLPQSLLAKILAKSIESINK